MNNRNCSIALKKVYIVIFCIIISLPIIQTKTSIFSDIRVGKFIFTANILNEKRDKAGYPFFFIPKTLSVTNFISASENYTKSYEKYINDNFGFRDYFISLSNTIDVKLFNKSTSKNVFIGKNGYLYIGEEMKDYDRNSGLSDEDITKIAKNIKEFQNKLAAEGKNYIFYVAPNKSTIYPEDVGRTPLYNSRENNYDKFVKALEKENVNTFDVKKFLLGYKNKYQLYYKSDTHWNNIAAALVGNHVLSTFKDKYGDIGDVSIKNVHQENYYGDLDGLLGLAGGRQEYTADIKIENKNVLLPKSLGYFDSFSYSVLNILNTCFSERIDYYNVQQPLEDTFPSVDSDAKLVYFEIVERYLPQLKDYNFDVLDDSKVDTKDFQSELKLNLDYDQNKSNMQLNQTSYQRADNGDYFYVSTGNDSNIVWNIPSTDIKTININCSRIDKNSEMQLFWAAPDQLFDDQRSIKLKLVPSKKNYVVNLKDEIKGTVKFRVDIDSKKDVELDLKNIMLYK